MALIYTATYGNAHMLNLYLSNHVRLEIDVRLDVAYVSIKWNVRSNLYFAITAAHYKYIRRFSSRPFTIVCLIF